LKPEEAKKLLQILKGDVDLLLYFTRKDGFKVLVDSLEFNHEALHLFQELVSPDEKQIEFFQRHKGYEALIDFLFLKNSNTEGKLLEPKVVQLIMEIIEEATMN